MIFPEDEEFLAHFGVKGMKWGIRKEDETGGYSKSELYNRKYGPDSMKEDGEKPKSVEEAKGFDRLSPEQKKAAVAIGSVALAVGLVGAAAGGKYVYDIKKFESLLEKAAREKELAELARRELKRLASIGEDPVGSGVLGRGLAYHWDRPVDLPAGSIIQRMSSIKETSIRPKGFFGSHDKDDVERYVRVLPTYWPSWGVKDTAGGGFLTQIRAKRGVKAPSGKETIELFSRIVDDDATLRMYVPRFDPTALSPAEREKVVRGVAVKAFKQFSVHWANGLDNDRSVQSFFGYVREAGFNALIDFNDAGELAKTPLRIIDTDGFDIVGHVRVGPERIAAAAKAVKELVMSAIRNEFGFMIFPEDEDFLAHYGKKGMKWGQRKGAIPGVSAKTNRAAKKDAKEFARAKMFYGEGAGTRRKLIKATVEAKSKKDPSYKKAFDSHLGNQDMASQASKARGERKRKDVATKTKQRVGYLARKATGEMGTQAAFTAVAIGGIAFAKSPKGQKIMKESALKVKQAANYSKNKKIFDQMMKNMG